jgi:hypothetical protein
VVVAACLEECKIFVALCIEVRGLVCGFAVINIVVLYYSKGRRTGFWVCIIADRWNTIIVKM